MNTKLFKFKNQKMDLGIEEVSFLVGKKFGPIHFVWYLAKNGGLSLTAYTTTTTKSICQATN